MSIRRCAKRYKTIEYGGLRLFPVLVKEYDTFLLARGAIEVMQQTLPVALMRVPLLSALYRMDYEAAVSGKPTSGLFARTLLALALSLRLGMGKDPTERVGMFQPVTKPDNPADLMCLRFADDDGAVKEITPMAYQTIRQIIAEQNGIKLESEQANPDLVKAQRDMESIGSIQIDANIDDLITAVSVVTGADETEIDEWALLRLDRRAEAIRRMLGYVVCGIGEASGASWKGGNPNPHPFFQRATEGTALTALGASADGTKSEAPSAATQMSETTKNL